jgi:TatD DNase family protein
MIYAGIGLHPSDLYGLVDDATCENLRKLAGHPKVITWSETGLDYMPDSPNRQIQHQAFRAQIRIARELNLPLVVHSREADQDTLQILREEHADSVGGAWHYFQGDLPTARAAMELGFYISLAKPLLRLPDLQNVASQLPLDSIVLETDSFPQPFKKYRERWTEPFHLPMVAQELARLHNISVSEVASFTTANALKMLRHRISNSISG